MSRSLFALSLVPALLAPALLSGAPALAQDATGGSGGGERVNQLIVYGDDPCPTPTSPDEITVCARKDEGERFRIPEALRGMDSPAARSWTDRVLAYETITRKGTLSCSPVGAGGSLGCTQKLIDAAYAEKRGDATVKFSELIAAERDRRLATIDADAAETQQRVEEIERQYDARQRQQADPQATP